VDDDVASGNVGRMAQSLGWEAKVEREVGEIRVVLTRGEGAPDAALEAAALSCGPEARRPEVVLFVTSDLLGAGDPELGRVLMRAFLKTIGDVDPRPGKAIFANSGVRLTTEGSDLVDDLRRLDESGVEVLSCGTCLDFYGLVEKLRVGRASNMFEIASSLVGADRVVRP
jgi:selenium metabolism protein YedF